MLGVFPLIVMFLITSITMQRERVSGTLERILTTPLRRLDLLAAYGTAFSIAAAAQATLACIVSFWLLGLDTAGSPILVFVIAIINAVLGVGLGLLCSAFARTEFQAVQFMPVVIVPQLLLCGIIVPRDVLPDWLQWISNALPASYALEALQQVGAHPGSDRHRGARHRRRRRVRGGGDCAWPRPPCDDGPRNGLTANGERRRPGRPPGTSDTRDRILVSARELFARNGIDKTSIRAIAADAGVDPRWCTTTSAPRQQLFAAAIHIPIDPMQVIGPLRETPVEETRLYAAVAAAAAVGFRDGQGIHRDPALAAGGQRIVSLVRSFLQEVIAAEVGHARRQPARQRKDPRSVRGVAVGRRGDGALHPRAGPVQVAAGRADRRDHRAEPAALPHRRPARIRLIRRASSRSCSASSSRDGLVDQQDGNAVLDAVRTAQPRVVQHSSSTQQQRPAVRRADQDARAVSRRARRRFSRAGC